MSNSGGSSPFLESPMHSPSKVNGSTDKERKIMSLQYKLNTLQNEFEIERLRLQQQNNAVDKKHRTTVEELEKALNDTKYLYDSNVKLEQQVVSLKEQLNSVEKNKDGIIQDLKSQLHSKKKDDANSLSSCHSQLTSAEHVIEGLKIEVQGTKSLLKRYEEEISRQASEIKQLQMANADKNDEISTLRATRVVMAHHNYSTEELQELTIVNKALKDQIQYTKELEEVNLQQANELKKLRIANESHQFWKQENDKSQKILEQKTLLERKLEEAQLENINLKSQLTSWEIPSNPKDRPEDILRDWKLSKENLVVLTNENEKLHLDVSNLKVLNDELAMERNQLLDLNKNYENSIVNLKRLNHEIEQQKQLSFEECKILRKQLNELAAFNLEAEQQNGMKEMEGFRSYEEIVDNYKNKTEDLTEELRKLNDQLLSQEPSFKKRKWSDELGLNYAQRLNELQLKNVNLLRELQKSQGTTRILEEKIQNLTALKEKKIRILQLRDNPLLKDQFVKRKQLELLKKENHDLIQELDSQGASLAEQVPRSVYDSLNFQLRQRDEDLFRSGKRFARLKDVFNKKSLEFIDVVNSLLGFKLEFQQEGKVKIFSCFKPERYLIADLNQNTLKSNLNSDLRDWESLLHLWVEERGQIPCFLATITLRLWELSL